MNDGRFPIVPIVGVTWSSSALVTCRDPQDRFLSTVSMNVLGLTLLHGLSIG
jgi:hypothetical protein